jgi:hypothetical protein
MAKIVTSTCLYLYFNFNSSLQAMPVVLALPHCTGQSRHCQWRRAARRWHCWAVFDTP